MLRRQAQIPFEVKTYKKHIFLRFFHIGNHKHFEERVFYVPERRSGGKLQAKNSSQDNVERGSFRDSPANHARERNYRENTPIFFKSEENYREQRSQYRSDPQRNFHYRNLNLQPRLKSFNNGIPQKVASWNNMEFSSEKFDTLSEENFVSNGLKFRATKPLYFNPPDPEYQRPQGRHLNSSHKEYDQKPHTNNVLKYNTDPKGVYPDSRNTRPKTNQFNNSFINAYRPVSESAYPKVEGEHIVNYLGARGSKPKYDMYYKQHNHNKYNSRSRQLSLTNSMIPTLAGDDRKERVDKRYDETHLFIKQKKPQETYNSHSPSFRHSFPRHDRTDQSSRRTFPIRRPLTHEEQMAKVREAAEREAYREKFQYKHEWPKMLTRIHGITDPIIMHLEKLVEDKAYRHQQKLVIVQNEVNVRDLALKNFPIKSLIIHAPDKPKSKYEIQSPALDYIENPQLIKAENYYIASIDMARKILGSAAKPDRHEIFAEVPFPVIQMPEKNEINRLLVLDSANEAIDFGMLIRSAKAFGWQGSFMGPRTNDIYNDFVMRSSGFHSLTWPCVYGNHEDLLTFLEQNELSLLTAGVIPPEIKNKSTSIIKGTNLLFWTSSFRKEYTGALPSRIALYLSRRIAHIPEFALQAMKVGISTTEVDGIMDISSAGSILMWEINKILDKNLGVQKAPDDWPRLRISTEKKQNPQITSFIDRKFDPIT
ncbi:hypothetical protein G9A89_016901 [Geosiphon pyriformis]|nr:hypothetical protein G9A89_016901 [Geosiphon pyriformis]